MIVASDFTEFDEMRTMDLTALRSFVTVAEGGSVTRAAGLLNLTQSAVSMQIKRLEDSIGVVLFLRTTRRLVLTPEGEQLLGFAHNMLRLNDEALARLTSDGFEGEIRLGVPHDIVYPAIPGILKRLASIFPRVKINLVSSFTLLLHEAFARGALDVILTTEDRPRAGGEVLSTRRLVWVGGHGGSAWQRRPLRLGFKETCVFKPMAQSALTEAGIPWEIGVEGESEQAIEATVAADLAITARLESGLPTGTEAIDSRASLPDLGRLGICLYVAPTLKGPAASALLSEIRDSYADVSQRMAAQ